VQPVQLGYVHLLLKTLSDRLCRLLFTTFSVQLKCIGYLQSLFDSTLRAAILGYRYVGKVLHLVSLRASFSRRNPSVQQWSCVRRNFYPFFHLFHFSNSLIPVIFTWRKPENLVTIIDPRGRRKGQETPLFFCAVLGDTTFFLRGLFYFWSKKAGSYGRSSGRETSHFFFCAVQGLLFRGVIFPGYSGCMYLETVQYGCFCLKNSRNCCWYLHWYCTDVGSWKY